MRRYSMKRVIKAELTIDNLGSWMKEKRKFWGYTQEYLAKKTGFHGNTIRRYESDESSPTLEDAEGIIKVLGGELVIREQ